MIKQIKRCLIKSSTQIVLVAVMLQSGTAFGDHDYTMKKNIISLKLGSYTLNKSEQAMEILGNQVDCWLSSSSNCYNRNPLPVQIETAATPPNIGLEYERIIRRGLSFGVDIFQSTHRYTIPSLNPSEGELEVRYLFANLKKYFGNPQGLQLFWLQVSGPLKQS